MAARQASLLADTVDAGQSMDRRLREMMDGIDPQGPPDPSASGDPHAVAWSQLARRRMDRLRRSEQASLSQDRERDRPRCGRQRRRVQANRAEYMTLRDRIREMWDARLRQRVTLAGAGYIFAIVLTGVAAFLSANNLLFLILAAMLASLMLSGFIGRLSLAELELDLDMPRHTCARRTIRARVRITNLKRFLPSFSVHLAFSRASDGPRQPVLYFPLITGGATIEEPVDLYFAKRGAYTQRHFDVLTRFPFGFVERREQVTIRQEIVVYPCLDPRPGFEQLLTEIESGMASVVRGHEGEFHRIRPHEATESARHMDWKASARTGTLQVREFAKPRDLTVAICLDLNLTQTEQHLWFEEAVECAAFLAFELANRARVRFLTQELDVTTQDAGDIYTILKYLALVSPQNAEPQVVPDDNFFEIVFTQSPEKFRKLGWFRAAHRCVGPDLVRR